jgi:hypothetical protein
MHPSIGLRKVSSAKIFSCTMIEPASILRPHHRRREKMIRFVKETKGIVGWIIAVLLVMTGLFVSNDNASSRSFDATGRAFNLADAGTTTR